MLATIRRRTLAACVSVMLMLGLVGWTSSPSQADETLFPLSGRVDAAPGGGRGIENVTVRIYRSTSGSASGPWSLLEVTHTSGASDEEGDWNAEVPAGTYRVTFNELDDGSAAWDAYLPKVWAEEEIYGGATTFTLTDNGRSLGYTSLSYRGGIITGTISDQCGYLIQNATIEAYADGDTTPQVSLKASSAYEGGYSIHSLGGATKLRIQHDDDGSTGSAHEVEWFKDAASYAQATPLTVAAGQTANQDIVLTRILDDSGTTPSVDGWVKGPEGDGIPDVTVRFYGHSNDPGDPWILEEQVQTQGPDGGGSDQWVGHYSATLPAGEYRVTFNELDDGSPASETWLPSPASVDDATTFCMEGNHSYGRPDTVLAYDNGMITGTVTDPRGNPIPDTTVTLFDGDEGSGLESEAVRSVTTKEDGTYVMPSIEGPAKLRFVPAKVNVGGVDLKLHATQWSGGTGSYADATTEATGPGETAQLDATLDDAPIAVTGRTKISGTARVGGTLTATLQTNYDDAGFTKSYQWFRTKGRTTTSIPGAIQSQYTATASDLGSALSARVTVTPLPTYPGVLPDSSTSFPTEVVRRQSHVSASAKAIGGGKFTVTVTVTVDGVSSPSGQVYVSWVRLTQQGNSLVPTGSWASKLVSYSNGKATYTIKVSKLGYWAWEAYHPDTPTVRSSSADGYLKVR